MEKIGVLVVDDSALMRKYIKQIINEEPDMTVLDTARDGEEAVDKAISLKPQVITMDINMPRMDGITALQYIMAQAPCPVVMLSSLTQKGALATFEALELGAVDFISKPDGTVSQEIFKIKEEIKAKVRAAANSRRPAKFRPEQKKIREKKQAPIKTVTAPANVNIERVVIIGVSTGGPKTLMDILPLLSPDLPAPVVVVQHMPAGFTAPFAQRLNQHCRLRVKEAANGDVLEQGVIYVARGGYHLKASHNQVDKGVKLFISREPKDTLFMPSVHVTMESFYKALGPERLVGVLLTGLGDDGADMMVRIRRGGGVTIAESEETAVVWGMPREAYLRGGVQHLVPSYQVAERIMEALK
ncbi:chemotaxis response regulator protein-glutamate methylesterase [Desulfallas sp. Bu1-1]|uniref:protein-glutamate methylesterase/protein-glutamine glutaminase n=1 Tax=Desulfallas sp. Bu1-1 TaxID=2787620 RepID=UPI00189CC783|nr:chemotaxis response regulator protein-glutamate methylesterase [Desulfallas sp. Bu1-1]MBF7084207.1 chemotaxis response regulator protein-glutamate methylesterase [Desulfallas sp. Bu1-1]